MKAWDGYNALFGVSKVAGSMRLLAVVSALERIVLKAAVAPIVAVAAFPLRLTCVQSLRPTSQPERRSREPTVKILR